MDAQAPGPNVDPITLTVVWNGLLAIAEEMGSTLRRTAFSEAVREGEDFSTGVFDRQARLIAQGNFTPGHLGSMPYVVKTVLEYFPAETLKPGDAVLLNDSFLGSGHFPDCFLVSPVFAAADLVGFVVTTAHHIDVGGAAPGSQRVHGVMEAFQEGLRILPVRLIREGAFDADILRMILANVRVPEKVEGDLRAQANANRAGVARLAELYASHGAAVAEAAYDAILDRSEARMRDLIQA
ncbi:MAG: hydantoinase B/oxoprolinase family protein, partial [Alphaproteobacteria bacterium]